MIICEECGTRNRNEAYVCGQCGAGLLHLEATEDDDAVPLKRKTPLFGRKTRPADEILPLTEDEENDSAETPLSEDDGTVQPEAEQAADLIRRGRSLFGRKTRPADEILPLTEGEENASAETSLSEDDGFEQPEQEADSIRRGRPLFGKKARLEAEEPPYYTEDEPEKDEETLLDEGPGQAAEPLMGETADNEPISEEQPEPVSEILSDDDPVDEKIAADEEPGENSLRFEFEEAEVEETPRIEYKQPLRVNTPPRFEDSLTEIDDAPSSITIDVEVATFDEEDDEYDDEDGYEDESGHKADYKTVYNARRRESEGMTRGMIAAIITVSSLLVVTLVVLGVLLIGKHNRSVPVVATMAPTETAAPTAEPTPVPTPSPTPVPTTTATPEEEYSSIFEQPEDGLLAEP
jgi:hypothetical protein